MPYTPCAVFFGQVLASWNPKTLGAVPSYYSAASPRELVPLIVAVDGLTREEEAVRSCVWPTATESAGSKSMMA